MPPLNQELYERLHKSFREVKISHEAEAHQSSVIRNVVKNRDELVIKEAGETYRICCPFCTDTRFRCNVNHMYGQRDKLGRAMYHLVYCYNDGCSLQLRDSETLKKFRTMMTTNPPQDLSKSKIGSSKPVNLDNIRMNWPGNVIRIDRLPANHLAVRYLEQERKFDVKRLGKYYNVHWCDASDKPFCRDRIIVPIYHNRHMIGWQARCPYDLPDWKTVTYPKYFTAPGTPKNKILYNLTQAAKFKFFVICEGVTDVWRVGLRSVCTLGAGVLKEEQLNLLITHFRDYSGVLLYDGDIQSKLTDQLRNRLELITSQLNDTLKGGFCQVLLPADRDPASMTRSELLTQIQHTCAERSVVIDWGLR